MKVERDYILYLSLLLYCHDRLQFFTDIQTGGAVTRSTTKLQRQLVDNSSTSGDGDYEIIEPPGRRFAVISESLKKYRNFKLKGKECVIKILDPPSDINMIEWIEGAFRDLTTHITASCNSHDHNGFSVNFDRLNNGPVWSRFKDVRDCNA